jgi:hypothetical protein
VAAKKKFLLRLDPKVYEEVHRWADDELRSVNSHIEYLLRKALREAGRPTSLPKASSTDEPKDQT